MRKFIRMLEVPILLLAISFGTYVDGSYWTAIFLLTVSIIRLWVNVVTDNIIYRD
jgi:ABC-type antimicrobial peptide transport system permease subunit